MNKFFKSLSFALILCITCMSAVCAFASGTVSATVSYSPSNGSVTVSGNSSGLTTVYVLSDGAAVSDVTVSNLYTHFDLIQGSELPYTFYMPSSAPYGKYTVTILAGDSAADSFMYYDTAAADALIPTLNSSQSASQLEGAIRSNAPALGIDMSNSFISANLSKSSVILYAAFMPFADSSDFYNKFNACLAMAAMNGADKSTIEAMLSGYSLYLGIEYDDMYAVLSTEVAADVCQLLAAMDFVSEYKKLDAENKTVSFANLLERTIALSNARLAQNWTALKKVFDTDYASVLSDITSSNSSFSKAVETNTYKNLISKQPYTSFADLKSKFDAAVSEASVLNNSSVIYNPSKGGSTVSTPSGYTNPENQYEEIAQNNAETTVQTSISQPVLSTERAWYSDVSSDSWEYDAVSILGASGVISGYEDGTYRSTVSITRAEFAKLVVAAFDIKAAPVAFDDVNELDWFSPYVSAAAGSGIVNGYDGKFNPHSLITREDAAVIIYRTSGLLGADYGGTASFADILDVSLYAMPAVRALGNAGIINGDDASRFNPQANLTRAEAAQLLYNFINALK